MRRHRKARQYTMCDRLFAFAAGAVFLALTALASRSEAALGCFTDVPQQLAPGVASCTIDADCAGVGGVACTGGFCFCPNDPVFGPFCPCLQTPAAPAPILSHQALIILAMLLSAVGLLGVWRRGAVRQAGPRDV